MHTETFTCSYLLWRGGTNNTRWPRRPCVIRRRACGTFLNSWGHESDKDLLCTHANGRPVRSMVCGVYAKLKKVTPRSGTRASSTRFARPYSATVTQNGRSPRQRGPDPWASSRTRRSQHEELQLRVDRGGYGPDGGVRPPEYAEGVEQPAAGFAICRLCSTTTAAPGVPRMQIYTRHGSRECHGLENARSK